MAVQNFQIKVSVDSGSTDALSGLLGYEWYWSTSATDPTAGTAAMRFGPEAFLEIGMVDYDYTDVILYVWCRSVDRAGNKSAWVQFGGEDGSIDLGDREITGGYVFKDIFELF